MIIEDLSSLELSSIARGIPILGRDKGRWLLEKVKVFQPKSILELGTANGYSGIILGSTGATLTTIEKNPALAGEAKVNFHKHNIVANVIIGDGVEEIKKLSEYFDIIFIDFAKHKYIKVLEDCLRLTKPTALIIADNITMDGCQDFKKAISNNPKLRTEFVDIKDGLSCSIRLP